MNRKNLSLHMILGALLSVLLVGLDQLTKYLAVVYLRGKEPFVILQGIFELRYLENRGAAFGILQGKKPIFIIITILVMMLLVYVFIRIPLEKHFYALHGICIALFAGAIGNFIDRMTLDYVVDFFYFSLIDFPIFNVADIYVTCAMFVFVILFLFYYKEKDIDIISSRLFPWKKSSK